MFDSLPRGTVQTLNGNIQRASYIKQRLPNKSDLELLGLFFSNALTPYYDCMWDGMEPEVGHIIYRLSDNVPDDIRSCILIYPKMGKDEERWVTLSEWREEWERNCPEGIPNFDSLPKVDRANFLLSL